MALQHKLPQTINQGVKCFHNKPDSKYLRPAAYPIMPTALLVFQRHIKPFSAGLNWAHAHQMASPCSIPLSSTCPTLQVSFTMNQGTPKRVRDDKSYYCHHICHKVKKNYQLRNSIAKWVWFLFQMRKYPYHGPMVTLSNSVYIKTI